MPSSEGNKCRSLVGKPKIFILQACRGDRHDDPVTVCAAGTSNSDTDDVVDDYALQTFPAGADFITCYSTMKGSVATDSATATGSRDTLAEYKMDNRRRGLALIFNQEHFSSEKLRRHGTNVDRDNLKKRLKELKFKVETHNNLKQMEVLDKIGEAAEADHSDADCFLLVFLSHGEKDHVGTYDGKISIQDIISKFKGDQCSSLVGKPKIFIFQACRGRQRDNPVRDPAGGRRGGGGGAGDSDDVVDDCALQTLPAGADFIMCYSTVEGYVSVRSPQKGSWYIQDLCEMIGKYGHSHEFTEILTWVNSKVSHRSRESSNSEVRGKKQMPCFASMLTKRLYFRPKQ